ncbi:glycosyltransferase family 4 protein [Altererythrobacter aquiaggeris]|uniref:glycosyltransferase family 4 protein n=1 Tax=Aestuarierythrobacter aquiaggeris TaxID=1898396 RepID=UPI00301B3593
MPTIATGSGAEVYARNLAAGLAERGHEPALQLAAHRFEMMPWLSGLKPPFKPDVTIANSWSAAAFANAAPLVTIVHHVVHEPSLSEHKTVSQKVFHKAFVKPMELSAIAASRKVIAVSETTRKAVCELLGFDDAVTVLNGVDVDYYRPAVRNRTGRPIRLLFVGKPSRRKGFELVVQLAEQLGPKAHLTVIGAAPEPGIKLPSCEAKGRISRSELRSAYQQADFLVLPSHMEGFGYAAAEAMACGTPVICTVGGAVAEIAHPGQAAIVIEPDRLYDTAQAITRLAADSATYTAMRRAARSIAEADLDDKRWLDEMEQAVMNAASTDPSYNWGDQN